MLVATVLPTDRFMPLKVFETAPPIVQAELVQDAAVPPIKLFVRVKPLPLALLDSVMAVWVPVAV